LIGATVNAVDAALQCCLSFCLIAVITLSTRAWFLSHARNATQSTFVLLDASNANAKSTQASTQQTQ